MTPMFAAQVALDFTALGLRPEVFTLPSVEVAGMVLGPFSLRWYSLAYIGGILLGWALLRRMVREPYAPMSIPQVDDFITWATLGIIAGGRLGYVLFYNLHQYLAHPLDIFKLWDGGMSFHGGALGMAAAVVLYARANKLEWLRIIDYVACVAPIGQGLGRLANFINGELWGRPTGAAWGIIFPGAGPLPRHPSQLYEAAGEGLLLLIVLSLLFWRTDARTRPGLLVGVATAGFGLVRFGIEFFREPDAQLGYLALHLTMGQLLCLPMVVVGLVLIATSAGRQRVQPA